MPINTRKKRAADDKEENTIYTLVILSCYLCNNYYSFSCQNIVLITVHLKKNHYLAHFAPILKLRCPESIILLVIHSPIFQRLPVSYYHYLFPDDYLFLTKQLNYLLVAMLDTLFLTSFIAPIISTHLRRIG